MLTNFLKGNNKLKTQISNLSLYLLANIIASGIGVLINPFLAANLSPNDYAIIGYYISLNTLFLPLISFSLISFYTRKFFIAEKEELIKIKNTILTFQILAGLFSMFLIILFFNIYAKEVNLSLDVFPFLYLSISTIYFTNFFSFLLTEKRLLGKSKSFFNFTMIKLIVNTLSALLLVVFWKTGAEGRLSALLITSLISGGLALRNLNLKLYINKKILKEALLFSWPIFLSAILYFTFSGFDRLLLERLGDNKTLGIYNVAFQITAYLGIFGTAILQTFDPDIYKATAKKNIKKAMKVVGMIVGLVLIISIVFYVFATPIINILTFGKYLKSVPYAKILVFRNAATALAFASSGVIIGLGFPKVELANRIIGSIIAFFLFKHLINEYQFIGAAWGQTISLIMMSLVSIIFIVWKNGRLNKIKDD